MNEINFEIQDVEKIDLSMDVGIKEIYPPIENLEITPTKEQQVFTHENSYGYDNVTVEPIPDEYIIPEGILPITENTTYDVRRFAKVSASVHPTPNLQDKSITITENGTQNITHDNGYDGLRNVEVITNIESGGGKSIPIINSLTPLIYEYSGVTTVTTNATEINNLVNSSSQSAHNPSIVMTGIVTAFVRSDYTLSDNLTLIAETGWSDFTDGVTKQKGIVCWCDNINENFTITQASSGRMGIGIVCFELNPKPTITTIMSEHNFQTETGLLPLKAGLTIYCVNSISDTGYGFYELGNDYLHSMTYKEKSKIHSFAAKGRTKIYIYYVAEDCNSEFTRKSLSSIPSSFGWGVIGINLE